jgi:hypothetical protein
MTTVTTFATAGDELKLPADQATALVLSHPTVRR